MNTNCGLLNIGAAASITGGSAMFFGVHTGGRWFLGMATWGATRGAIGFATALWAIALSTNCASAQITPDKTLPNNSTIRLDGNIHIIENGTQRGGNLFHSFKEFSVPTDGTAFFNNATDIQNIFSRVTGGSVSNIDGIIKANGTANLFLINPNGIVFGKNASLNIGGSFVGTTANAIQFGNQGFFSATNPEALSPLLTINPSALFYNQIAAASIQNNSVALLAEKDPAGFDVSGLRVPDGKSLLLVGGNINMDGGQLNAYGGRVELGGLAARGSVGLNVDGDKLSLDFPAASTRADISLTNNAQVYVEAAGGGNIAVNARNLEVSGVSVLSAGIGKGLGNAGAKAGDITLNATEDIKIDGSSITNSVRRQGIGNGGNITSSSNSLALTNGAQFSAITFGQGNAGNVIINATKSVSLDGSSAIFSQVGDVNDTPEQRNAIKGNGGNIQITSPQLSLTNGAGLQTGTDGQGDAGNVIVNATKSVFLDGSNTAIFSSVGSVNDSPEQRNAVKGSGGNIQITSPQLSLTNGAELVASTLGQGDAGNVIINATKSVSLDGSYTNINGQSLASGIFSTVGNVSDSPGQRNAIKGSGGNIQITSPQLSLTNGAELVASTLGQGDAGNVIINATNSVSLDGRRSDIFSSVGNVSDSPEQRNAIKGNGGNIQITSPQLSLTNGAQLIASTHGQGDAGNVTVNALDAVSLAGNAYIFSTVDTGGVGKGGNININAATLSLKDGAQLQTLTREASSLPAGRGDAGNVNVKVTGTVDIAGEKNGFQSGIISRVETGTQGNGGNITIDSGSFSLREGARLEASTLGQGNAGTIKVNAAQDVTISGKSSNYNSGLYVNSQSPTGTAGDIIVTSPRVTLDNSGTLNAESASGNGGSINLQSGLLLLRRGAKISTSAGTAEARGNGGNITINTPNGFIVSVPNENSDITANAFNGSGGVIKINALGIYNFTQRSREDLMRELGTNDPNLLKPQRLQTNDITAFSQTNPILSGQVNIITPNIDPARGLVQLPTVEVNPPKLISSACASASDNSFTITGRGGLPPSPDEPLTNDVIWTDARIPATTQQSSNKPPIKPHSKPKAEPIAIVPATGWVFNGLGEVTLISSAPNTSGLGTTPATCPAK